MYLITAMPSTSKLLKKTSPLQSAASWTFLTNHAHVLLCLAGDDSLRVRDLALRVGITERAVLKILSELEMGGVLKRERDGRRNRYRIRTNSALRHELEAHCTVGDLIGLVHGFRSKSRQRN